MKGSRLRELRKQHKYTLQYIGDVLGVSYQSVQKKERKGDEHVDLSFDEITALANLFNEPVHNFYPSEVDNSTVTVTADNGSVAQSSGGDSYAHVNGNKNYTPRSLLDRQLFSLILDVGTETYKKGEIKKLLNVKKMLEGEVE